MKNLLQWIKAHPVKTALPIVGGLGFAALAAFNFPDEFTCCWMPWLAIGCIGLMFGPMAFGKRRITALLVAAMLFPTGLHATPAPPPGPGPGTQKCGLWLYVAVGAAIAGVAAGGRYIYVKYKQACERLKKKKEKDQKEAEGDDQASAIKGCRNGSCARQADGMPMPEPVRQYHEFDMVRGEILWGTFRFIDESELIDWEEWRDQLNLEGLAVTGDGYFQEHTVGNRITFDGTWAVVDNGGLPISVAVSTDLEHWEEVFAINSPGDLPIHVEGSSLEGHLFYRVTK